MKVPLEAFKAARLFIYIRCTCVPAMQPTVGDVDSLSNFPFIDTVTIEKLKTELPNCADTDANFFVVRGKQIAQN